MLQGPIEIDVDAFRAALWPTLRGLTVDERNRPITFRTPEVVVRACNNPAVRNGEHVESELHLIAYEFLWDAVRLGLVVPVESGNFGAYPFQNHRFAFTEAGRVWRTAQGKGANPFSPSFAAELTQTTPKFPPEAVVLIGDTLRAMKAGLPRAAMFLLGLLNEHVLAELFDSGIASGKVSIKASKKNPGKAFAMQSDVRDALAANEPKPLPPGTADEWTAIVSALRNYRNACVHDAAYEPSVPELHAALFMLPRFAELTNRAFLALA